MRSKVPLPLLLGLNGTATVALSQSGYVHRHSSLSTPRVSHTATLLPNAKVLVAGGSVISSSAPSVFSNAEHYDPSTGTRVSPGDLTFEETVAAINHFRPDVLRGYGSYLGVLFREVHRRKILMHRPNLVTYGADAMANADRLLIEQEFGIPVSSTYQCVEALRIGFFCKQRRGFHLSLDAVVVRLVDDQGRDVEPGAAGHVVLSNLTNRATVLLNYKLGDIATASTTACPCGRTLPMIEALQGRSDDMLQLAEKRPMHGLTALEALQSVPGVLQVQIVQHALDRFALRAVKKSGANQAEAAAALIRGLRSKVGKDAYIDVEWMETIPPGPNGKVKAVVSEFRPFSDSG